MVEHCYFEEQISITAAKGLTPLRVTECVSERGEAGRYIPTIWIFLEVFNYQMF